MTSGRKVQDGGRPLPIGLCLLLLMLSVAPASCLDVGKFWHVTDFHYDQTYGRAGLSCVQPVSRPSPLGNQWCDSPWTLVSAAIDAMATSVTDVDFVLWTGDTVAHIKDSRMNFSVNTDVMSNVTQALAAAFPNTPVYPAFGNHDNYPAHQFPPTPSAIYNVTAAMWEGWIQEADQLDNFRKGGYYTRVLPGAGHLRVVALNANLYYTSDRATRGLTDPTGQLAWLNDTLTTARQQGQKVILMAHIPPGVHTPRGVQWYQPAYVKPFNDVIKTFSDVITAMHFGHDHQDGFKILHDQRGKAAVPIFVAPSVTPWRYKVDGKTSDAHNPSVRLVTYDRTTGRHLDIVQYAMDLDTAIRTGTANFTLLYKFTKQYGLSDLTAASVDSLVSRMENSTGADRLLDNYFRFSLAGAPGASCDGRCRNSIVCGMRTQDLAAFTQCLQDRATGHAPTSTPPLALPALLVALGTARLGLSAAV